MSQKINIAIFLGIIFSLGIIFIVKEDELLSYAERRYLMQVDDIKLEDIKEGEIVTKIENYALDQFPLREELRALKAFANYNIFMKEENQGIAVTQNTMYEIKDSYDYNKLKNSVASINTVANSMFYENDCYFVLIPDKSCYINSNNNYSYLDIEKELTKFLHPRISYIPIYHTLSLDSYYKTDLHWSQDKLTDTKNAILNSIGYNESENYSSNKIEGYFGSYAVKSALSYIEDDIIYLTNERINSAQVFNYETNTTTNVYDLAKLQNEKSLDKYDIFLSGASPLLKVSAPESTGKTLILFRDSFGSSLAPLLLEYYDTIYLVDLRYIDASLLQNFIDISSDYDVIFLYSTDMLEIPGNFK